MSLVYIGHAPQLIIIALVTEGKSHHFHYRLRRKDNQIFVSILVNVLNKLLNAQRCAKYEKNVDEMSVVHAVNFE